MKFRIIFGLLAVAFVASSPAMASSSSEGNEMMGARVTSSKNIAQKDHSEVNSGISNTVDGEGQEFSYTHRMNDSQEIRGTHSSLPFGIVNYSEGKGQEYMGS